MSKKIGKRKILALLAAAFLILGLGFGIEVGEEQRSVIVSVVSELSDSFSGAE